MPGKTAGQGSGEHLPRRNEKKTGQVRFPVRACLHNPGAEAFALLRARGQFLWPGGAFSLGQKGGECCSLMQT